MNVRCIPRIMLAGVIAVVLGANVVHAVEVTRFNGAATDIGIQREPGGTGGVEYRIRGDFEYAPPLDLSDSVVTWEALLVEIGAGAAGELIKTIDDAPVVPLAIPSRTQSRPDYAVYQTEGYRPQVRFQIRRTRGTRFDFRLKLDRGLSRQVPQLCTGDPPGQKSQFLHRFTIDDGVNPVLVVETVQIWDCSNLEGFQLKARQEQFGTPSPGPTPGPTVTPPPGGTPVPGGGERPAASLRVEALTRNTGEPDLVELDARGSTDRNGTIVRWRFDSGDGRVQDGASPTAQFVYAPGSYRPSVTVFDDDGNQASASRGFSDK